jgi:hypothetical protein
MNAFFIALITSLFGVIFSAVLWRTGLEDMSWRYPTAVLLSYVLLLPMLWMWSHRTRWDGQIDLPNGGLRSGVESRSACVDGAHSDFSAGGGEFGGAGASGSFDAPLSDAGSVAGEAASTSLEVAAGAGEGAVVLLPLAMTVALVLLCAGLAFGAVSLVWQAPALLAELMIDAGTAGLLWVYVRPSDRRDWLGTAFRKTAPSFIAFALAFALFGFFLEWLDPQAITVFDVLANRAVVLP